LTVAALVALTMGSGATAQTNSPYPSPAKLEADGRLLKTMHTDRLAEQMSTSLMASLVQTLPADQPGRHAGDRGRHRRCVA
jgi:hypothetical protein